MNSITKIVFFTISSLFLNSVYAEPSDYCDSQRNLIKKLETIHLSPLKSDSLLAIRVSTTLLEYLDPYSVYFTTLDKEEIYKTLQKLISTNNCTGTKEIGLLLNSRLLHFKKEINSISFNSLQFQSSDSLNLDDYERTENHIEKWKKYFQATVLEKHFQSNSSLTEKSMAIPDSLFQQVTLKWICRTNKLISKLSSTDYLQKIMLQSIANAYDPHTNYLRENDYLNYISNISKEKQSFGFLVDEGLGTFEIIHVDKNSPAWNSGVRDGDHLMSIKQNRLSLINNCDEAHDLNKKLSNPDLISIQLELIRKDSAFNISLQKKGYNIRDDAYLSMLLNGKKKIGYFKLGSFYTDMEYKLNDGCSNDVAAELIKMKRDQIDGLILDLRNNGGGSMYEAISLAGIFIDFGKLAYLRLPSGEIESMRDFNKGKIFKKPLVLLINEQSASAAEIVATILKDYGVALLVGNQTFGKYIGQTIIEVNVENQSAYLVSTDMQFYNLKGESYQSIGQKPDIKLPSMGAERLEAYLPFPISQDKINIKLIQTNNTIPYSTLKLNSAERTKELNENTISFSELIEKIPLNPMSYVEWRSEISNYSEKISGKNQKIYEITPTSYDEDLINLIKEEKENFLSDKIEVESDPEITEAYQIIIDWINLKQNEKN